MTACTKASQENQVTVQRQFFFLFGLERCHWYRFWFVMISRTLAKKTHPRLHTGNLRGSQFENCDKCPNIFILKWEISAKKSGVTEICMSEITDSFTTHLHCRLHTGKTEFAYTGLYHLGGFPLMSSLILKWYEHHFISMITAKKSFEYSYFE